MKTLTKLYEAKDIVNISEIPVGKLFRFKGQSEVYKVLEQGYWIDILGMYSEKKSRIKKYIEKRNKTFERTVEPMDFY